VRVLLVDDNPTALKMLAHAFATAGFDVDVAEDGVQALAQAQAVKPDVVVMDVMMPNMDGIEATRQLRANPDTARLPILLLTARDGIEAKLVGFDSGADDYVVKPVLPAELIARVNALFRRARRYATAPERGRVLGVWGVKGGVGTTTISVNLAISLAEAGRRVILADFAPWCGAVAAHMGLVLRVSVEAYARCAADEIDRRLVEDSLERHRSGVMVFGVPLRSAQRIGVLETVKLIAILDLLETMAGVVVLDLGSGLGPSVSALLPRCHTAAVILEADAVALALASHALEQMEALGLVGSRLFPVLVNRTRRAATFARDEIESALGTELAALIAPAPEVFFHSTKSSVPVLLGQPDSLISTQLRELSGKLV